MAVAVEVPGNAKAKLTTSVATFPMFTYTKQNVRLLNRFWCRFDPSPSPTGLGGLETVKAEGHIFKMLSRLQINPGSAGYLS